MTLRRTLTRVIEEVVEREMGDLYTALPARVETYDAATQTCSVQPSIKAGYEDESGERVAQRIAVITDVPVVFFGSGRVTWHVELQKGDPVLLLFSMQALDKWFSVASTKPIDPDDDRRHELTDAIAIPGLRNLAEVLSRSGSWVGNATGPAFIEFKDDDTIEAGGNQLLALQSELQSIRDELHNHEHSCPNTGTGSPVPTTGGPSLTNPSGTTVLKGG